MDIRRHLSRHVGLRWLAMVLCALQMLAAHGAHARSMSGGPSEHIFCGTPTAAALASLADWAPDEYARALGQLAGAGEHCGAHCAGAAPPLPGGTPALGFGPPAAGRLLAAAPAVPALARFGPLKPPSTAPPAQG